MADATNTLAGILNLGDANVEIEVSNLLQGTPVLNAMEAVPSTHGHTHKYIRETVAAGGGFRAANAGISNSAGSIELETETLKFLDASWEDDVAIAKAMATGKGGVEAWIADRTRRSLAAAFVTVEKQFIYGDQAPGLTAGFQGLIDVIDSSMVVDKGGSTADVQTSIYAIRTSPTDAAAVFNGQDGGLIEVSDVYNVRKVDGSSNPYSAYRCDIDGYLGFQAGNKYTVGRLCNIESAVTDDDLAELLSKFPSGQQPSFLAMNRDALLYLQASRTATNPTGAPAPFPADAFGIPIIVTDQIVSTEAVVA
jgi:hypothetical protein